MSNEIFVVSSEIFSSHEIEQYEKRILDNKNISEQDASHFFFDFPKFLTIGGYKEIMREVVLYKTNQESLYRVDFCRRPVGEIFWDVIELKSPKYPFMVKNGIHWKFSSQVEKGIQQAQDYKDFFEQEINRLEVEKRIGIKLFRPKILIIAGRKDHSIDPLEIRRLVSRYHGVDIRSYDDIYSFATENYKSSLYVIPVIQNSDIPLPVIEQICPNCNGIMFETIYDRWQGDTDGYWPRYLPSYKCRKCGNEIVMWEFA